MKRRHRKFIGFLFLIVGLALPLYALTHLSLNAFFARSQYLDYRENVEAADDALLHRREAALAAYNARLHEEKARAAVDPFAQRDYRAKYDIETIGTDDIVAYVVIPKIDLIKPVYLGASREHLAKGLAHLEGTDLPLGGVSTRSVIAGHRGWYKDALLLHADELEAGDVVYVDRGVEVLTYTVTDKQVIHESDWDSLQVRPGEDVLTLLTCKEIVRHPAHRLIVNAVRASAGGADGVSSSGGGEANAADGVSAVGVGEASGADGAGSFGGGEANAADGLSADGGSTEGQAAGGAELEAEVSLDRADAAPPSTAHSVDLNAILEGTVVSPTAAASRIAVYVATLLGYVAMAVLLWRFVKFLRTPER
ncbi:MAG: class C sortase [Peptoniphilaceae bacterium]|nr:class C sortase [Peptoniphilaceae bacterium]MDY6085836.1 class C sortase [Peptoniphilaceae bacterium]